MRRFGLLLAFVFVTVPVTPAQDVGQFFDSKGVQIHYAESGLGEPVILIHGYTASRETWATSGVSDALVESGYRVIAMDMRGHGDSEKLHAVQDYGLEMVHDVVRLLDHLGLHRAHVVGYSMGGLIANKVREQYPSRVATVTVGGAGWWGAGRDEPLFSFDEVAADVVTGDLGPLLRVLVAAGHPLPTREEVATVNQAVFAANDPPALAAVMRGISPVATLTASELAANEVPALALVGDRDALIRDVRALAQVMDNLEVVEIPGASHLTALADELFARSLLAFLQKHDSD